MPKILHISVEEKHIKAGTPYGCLTCPIALAILEQHPEFPMRAVRNTFVFIWTEEKLPPIWGQPTIDRYWKSMISLPESAQDFIAAFDKGEAVTPFEFDWDVTQ